MLGALPTYRGVNLSTSAPSGSVTLEQTTDDTTSSGSSYPGGIGQSVTFGSSPGEVTGVRVRMTGASRQMTGMFRLAFYAQSSDLPTATAPVAASPFYGAEDMATAATDYYFHLSGWTPTGSTKYTFAVQPFNYFDAPSADAYGVRVNGSGGYADGVQVVNDTVASPDNNGAGNWSATINDLDFSVYEDSTPDVTAPVLSSPTGAATGPTTAQGQVTTDESNGTLYWVVTQSATQPSVAQIQAGQDHTGSAADASSSQSVTATGVQTVNAGGLVAETTYYFHFQQEDAATNDSNRVSSTSFDTDAASSDDFELRFRDGTYRRRYGFRGGMG